MTDEGRPALARIMVVDDSPDALKLMGMMLRKEGYSVGLFPRGRLALAAVAADPPDLVLLDINMPEMDGYEVCRRFKADPRTAGAPVIFLSAQGESEDKVNAFRSGGVDYITKPFSLEEVQARISTHLKIRKIQLDLERSGERRTEEDRARAGELAGSNRRLAALAEAKGDLLGRLAGEIRSPETGLFGLVETLLDRCPAGAEREELRGRFGDARRRILAILDEASRLDGNEAAAARPPATGEPG